MLSSPASVLSALALAGALVGVGVSTAGTPSQPATQTISAETSDGSPDAAPARDSISIECGGYDAEGRVMNEAATRIDRAPVDAAGIPEIPAVCGGYTADGAFIGDD